MSARSHKTSDDRRAVCVNRKARHDYLIEATVEAGLALRGGEVKALRQGNGNLVDAYALLRGGRVTLHDFEIARYSHDHTGGEQPRRSRALLLHAAEIRKLAMKLREPGMTLVPLAVYFKGPWAKVELGLARGKRKHDKREALKRRQDQREMDRAHRRRR
jgi:SsrA-binding protein